MKTREVTVPGFRHDLFAMNLSPFAGSPFCAAYKEKLVAHGLGFSGAAHCFATPFPDGSWLGVSRDIATTAQRIAAISATDAERWRKIASDFGTDAPHIFALLASPMPSLAAAKSVWKAYRAKGGAWLGELTRLLLSTSRDFLDAQFQSEKLKVMLAAWGMHLDFPPDVAGGALLPYLESMADQTFGMVVGQGGADTMIKALVGSFRSLGGELHLGRAVERIETSGDRATGVRLTGGEVLGARRAVIANAHPKLVFGDLLARDGRRAAYEAKLASFRAGPGTMMIHLALSGLPDWRAGEELKRFAYVHLAPSFEAMTATYAQAMAGLLPRESVLVVGQPTAIDPSRAPAGQHVLWVQVRVLPASIKGDAAGSIAATHWFASAMGARVILTSSSDEKLERARALGATDLINRHRTPDWHQAVRELTAGRGADHILEMAGGDNVQKSLEAVAIGGRISIVGLLEALDFRMSIVPLLFSRASIIGIGVGHRRALEDMVRAVDRIGLKPVIDARYSFAELPKAMAHLRRGAFGKVVVQVQD